MWLTSLRLTQYGPFRDHTCQFATEPGRISIVFASNGAGKSVLRQAIGDLLFGIHAQTDMAFRYGYAGMAIGATARLGNGANIAFGRRKGQGRTLTDGDGNPVDETLLASVRGTLGRQELERLFALDTERLRSGSRELLESGGDFAQSMLSARGLSGVRELAAALQQEADELAPARRSGRRPFYVALEAWGAAHKEARDALLRPDTWERRMAELTGAEADRDDARRRLQAVAAERSRLERLRRVRVPLARLDEAQAWLDRHPDAPHLPANARERLERTEAARRGAHEQLQQEDQRLARLRMEHGALPNDQAILEEASTIEDLVRSSGAVDQALRELGSLRNTHYALEVEVARLLKILGRAEADPASVLPDLSLRSRVKRSITAHGHLTEALERTSAVAAEQRRRLALEERTAAALAPVEDLRALDLLTTEIRASGDPVAVLRETQARLARAEAQVRASIGAVPAWTAGGDALRALVLPPDGQVAAVGDVLGVAANTLRHRQDAERARTAELEAARSRLPREQKGEPRTDRAALVSARADRDALWSLAAEILGRQRPLGTAAPDGTPLVLSFDRAVRHTDATTDRLLSAANALAETDAAQAAIAAAETERAAAAQEVEAAEVAYGSAQAAWRSLLPPLLAQLSPADWRTFVDARTRVLNDLAALETERATLERILERHRSWAARLRADARSDDLPSLLGAAERRIADAAGLAESHTRSTTRIAGLKDDVAAAAREREVVRDEFARWEVDWSNILQALGRPEHEAPAETEEVLRGLEHLASQLAESSTAAARVDALETTVNRFLSDVSTLAQSADSEGVPATPGEALTLVTALSQRLTRARENAGRSEALAREIATLERDLAPLREKTARAEAEFAAALGVIGSQDIDIAQGLVDAAEARAAHANQVAEALETLRDAGDGQAPNALRLEIAQLSADEAAALYAAAETSFEEESQHVQAHARTVGRIEAELGTLGATAAYADAVSKQMESAATLGHVLRDALRARLAAQMLADGLEELEQEGGSEMQVSVERWFRRLTGDVYTRLRAEPGDDGRLDLLAFVAPPDNERKTVEQLSEGERDQMFLAMRLAALESHPCDLPFIADDILQSFDENRVAAALEALRALSKRRQIILLTHHQHVAELARDMSAHVCGLV